MEDKLLQVCTKYNIQHVDNYLNASQIGKLLGLRNINSNIRCLLDNEKKIIKINTNGGPQKITFISINGFKQILTKSRKFIAKEIANELGLDILDMCIIPIETETLNFIKTCFANEKMIHQFPVDNYRIDLYFSDYNLAIECDEHHHKTENDNVRQEYIKNKINCTFLRYKPYNDKMALAKIINEIHKFIVNYYK